MEGIYTFNRNTLSFSARLLLSLDSHILPVHSPIDPQPSTFAMIPPPIYRAYKGTSPRSRLLYMTGGVLSLFFLIHLLFPSSNRILTTKSWTSASSTVLRSKFLRAKAQAPKPPIVHPIPGLIANARKEFDQKLARQSRTLSAAVVEYERRYNRKPPKGFDDWYAFAVEHGSTIIDEYDQLAKSLEPFWLFSGEEVRRRCIQVGYLPSVDLVRIEDGQTRTIDVSKGHDDSEVGARAKGFRVMLEKFQHKLPNMDFPINEKAEGRILVPWEENLYSNLTADSSREPYPYETGADDSRYRACVGRKVHPRLAKRRKCMGSLPTYLRPLVPSSTIVRLAPSSAQRRPNPHLSSSRCRYRLKCPYRRIHIFRNGR